MVRYVNSRQHVVSVTAVSACRYTASLLYFSHPPPSPAHHTISCVYLLCLFLPITLLFSSSHPVYHPIFFPSITLLLYPSGPLFHFSVLSPYPSSPSLPSLLRALTRSLSPTLCFLPLLIPPPATAYPCCLLHAL